MQVVGFKSTSTRARLRRRMQVVLVPVAAVAAAGLGFLPTDPTVVAGAATPTTTSPASTSTTIPGPVIPLAQFPVQGRCSFVDTYGATRSGGRKHEGVDLIAKSGQYVYAVNDGTLTRQYLAAKGSLTGNGWRLTTADGTYFFYAHLSGFAPGLAVGSTVVSGQIIGLVGMTGNAAIPHLHFEIHPGGGASVDPTPSVKAVDGCNVTTPPPVATNPTNVANTAPGTPTTPPATTSPATASPTSTTLAAGPVAGESAATDRWQLIEPVVALNGASASTLQPGVTKKVNITGLPGISPTTGGVLVRVSASVSRPGSIVVHPCSGAAPVATTLFVEPGAVAVGVTPVGLVKGQLCLTSNTPASVKITVIGQLAPSGVGVVPITARPLDSRQTGRLAANKTIVIAPSAFGAGASTRAVTATFTVLAPSAAGTLSVGPCDGTALRAPFAKAAVGAFSAVVAVSATGLCVTSSVGAHVVVDIDALWTDDAPMLRPIAAVRMFDSRDHGVHLGSTPIQVALGGLPGGPPDIASANINLTLLGRSSGASVFVWPCDKPQPEAAVGVVAANRRASFSVVSALSSGTVCLASNQPVDAIVDVSGAG